MLQFKTLCFRMILADVKQFDVLVKASNVQAGISSKQDWNFINWAADMHSLSSANLAEKEIVAVAKSCWIWGDAWAKGTVQAQTVN